MAHIQTKENEKLNQSRQSKDFVLVKAAAATAVSIGDKLPPNEQIRGKIKLPNCRISKADWKSILDRQTNSLKSSIKEMKRR